MKMTKQAAVAAAAAALLMLSAGQAMADASCVWSEPLERWICVPP